MEIKLIYFTPLMFLTKLRKTLSPIFFLIQWSRVFNRG